MARDGHPYFIAYVGPPYGVYFSKESLENALTYPSSLDL
jgi:hypothetical protein